MDIIYEDKDLLVVNKPAGMPAISLANFETDTLSYHLGQYLRDLTHVGKPFESGLVHRLDNSTSGICVVAKNQEVYNWLRKEWNHESVVKEYLALVVGALDKTSLTISTPIAHHPSNKKKMVICETLILAKKRKARPSLTELQKEKVYISNKGECSLVKVRITTGLRHQIRVHLASVGYPLCGDKLYQNPRQRKKDPTYAKFPLLHLAHITLGHPVTGKTLNFYCPPPDYWI